MFMFASLQTYPGINLSKENSDVAEEKINWKLKLYVYKWRWSRKRKQNALHKKIDNDKFAFVAPSRPDIEKRITGCLAKLSPTTIISGFAKAGLMTDIR
ncbi:LOW QUALITY PROTEIN: hypothetical protein PHMEG_0008264 [Phytophthora megakarya]|uniref:Uncharacterized protein n=1 Tax=Phytophthora megakarya TaxID=4795 RepID=A0A225WL95_9STRA|nr:LOW QUALITY PROTEIN: hypothetical protein PHMEG_0008264 [Phytophthora megakarya]